MANNSPTIVAASLDDKELKQSIANLVAHVKRGLHTMLTDTNSTVDAMEKKLTSLGKLKIDSGGSADGGASKRTSKLKEEETQTKANTQAIKENTAAKKENLTFDQRQKVLQTAMGVKSARDSHIAFMQGYKQQAKQTRRLMEEEQKAMQQRRQGVVDGFTKTIEERKARVKELSEEVAKLYKERPDGYRDAIKQRTEEMNALKQKIRELTDAQKNLANSPVGASNRYLELEKEYNRIKNIMIDTTNVQRQSSQESEKQTQSAQRYTEEIRRQAAAIRSSKEWQEKGHVVVGDINYYDKERANVSKRDKQLLLSLEEQIVQAQQKEAQEALVAAEAKRQQAQAAKEAAQASKGVSAYDLGIDPNVSAGRQRQIESTRKAAKETEYLMQQVASLLEVEEREVKSVNMATASYSELSQYLKQLQSAYNKLGADRIKKGEGTDIAKEIQSTQRAMQKLQQTMSRPVSLKDALGGSEKTLDDIAYKMQRLRSYKQGIDLTKPNAANEIKQVDEALAKLKKDADKWMSKSNKMIKSNTALGRSWNYMKNRLAFYFTVGASTQFVKNLIEVRSQYEMNERALGILINSAERGTQIFNELSQMALVSPYTLIELSTAAKQLTAYDVAAKDVVDTTRRLADMASAVGIPIERLTYALGQVKAYGYLNARDARMFANAGIPLVKNLSEYYTELEGRLVSTADIYDRIKKKQIGYEEVMSTISKMTDEGGKFFDFQAKMAETLKVQLANLTLAWNNMLNDMGEESQGVIVGGIGALKQMFLHWKDIEHILTEVVVALGAYKAYQLVTTRLMGSTAASLDAQILAMKRNNAVMLEKQALTRKLTVDELRQVAAQNQVTAADYRNAFSGKILTKQKALLLVALNKNNVQLKASLVNMGLLTTAEAASITRGKALAIVFKSIGISIKNAALAIKAFAASMWPLLVVGAIYELYHAWDSYGEHVKEVNKQASEHAKEAFENIKQYLESESTINTRQRVVYREVNPLTDVESQKAWDEMREKIELSSSASNTFIAKLMRINDINNRLAAGFDYLRDVQRVAGVMQTLEEDAVNVSSTTLGGIFGEGLKDDLNDFVDAYQRYVNLNENLRQSGVGEEYFNEQKRALEEFRSEVEKTTTSLYNIASREGFNINEQREFFERGISETAQAEQMGIKETRIYRMQAEQEYYAYARAQLMAQLEYQQGAQKAATEARIKDLDNEFGSNKAMQESFFTWLTEKQDHAVKNMLRGKTQEEIKQGEWLKGSNAKWVEEMARKFSKEYGVSFDGLRKLVMDANTWHINIPVFFQTIGQPLTDVQRDYEARTGKKFSSNPLIKDAKSQVEIIDILKKKQKEVANEMETARKAGGKYWENNKERYKKENDALVADIHAYNALTDAEEKANKKSGKGGSKKDTLLDALKQEISLVEKLQGDYDKLTKSGASQAEALETIRGAYGKTIRLLNAQLGKYGLPQLDISQIITDKDPNKALAHFKQTLNTLVSKGLLTLERSKEIEAVVEKLTLSAKTYNLDKITKGLNNELGKLKDEYELAVELDANPELGDMFADMFGINTSTLPKTFGDALDRAQIIINRKLAEMNITTPFDLMEGNIDSFAKSTGLDKDSAVIKELVSAQNAYRDMFKKNITETEKVLDDYIKKYGDYSDKIAEIEAGRLEKLKKLNEAYYTEEMRKRPEYAAKLNAIEQGASKEKQQVDFDEFKNSRYYTMMFENLDYISTKTIRDMRDRVRELIDTMNDLTPEQLKTLMSQYEKLEQKLVKRSPFKTLTKDLKEYFATSKERKAANQEFKNAQKEYDAQKKNVAALKEKYEQAKAISNTSKSYLDFLQIEIGGENEILKILKKQLDAAQKKADKYNITAKLAKSEALAVANVVGQNLQSLGELRDFLQQDLGIELSDELNGLVDGLSKVGQGINKITSSATSGDVVGVITGVGQTIYGLYDGIAGLFGGSKKDYFTPLKESLENLLEVMNKVSSYQLEALGRMTGSQAASEYRKLLQNNETIIQSYRDLANAAGRSGSSWGSHSYAYRTNRNLKGDWEEISKYANETVTSIQDMYSLDPSQLKEIMTNMPTVWAKIDKKIREALEGIIEYGDKAQEYTIALGEALTNISLDDLTNDFEGMLQDMDSKSEDFAENFEEYMRNAIIRSMMVGTYAEELENWYNNFKERIKDDELSEQDVEALRQEYMDIVNRALEERGRLTSVIGEAARQGDLSSLQQGIQGITETTANALEAYMNSVSQQAYLRNDILVQIRDTIQSFDIDVQTASLGQILLQLQASYQVQMSIQGILEGWATPSGQAVRVELVS